MAKIRKAQFGIRSRPPIREESSSGRRVTKFLKNPFTGATIIKEKDIEYGTEDSPRRVYKSKTISTKDGSEREMKVIKENGKVIKEYDSKNEPPKNNNKVPYILTMKKGGSVKKSSSKKK